MCALELIGNFTLSLCFMSKKLAIVKQQLVIDCHWLVVACEPKLSATDYG